MFGIPFLSPTLLACGVIAVLLGVQTLRLDNAQVTISDQKTQAAQLTANIATERVAGYQAGQAAQKTAQDEIVAAHVQIENGLRADAAARSAESAKIASTVASALSGSQWACLKAPLPSDVLDAYRRVGT